jgi:pSer/pThr/pTyr-binding forkhead associated (FHA) protein
MRMFSDHRSTDEPKKHERTRGRRCGTRISTEPHQNAEAREYLAYEEDGETKIVPLEREWTRVGRSLAADVRFDDSTVSRRHALIVRRPDGLRVLDDRSLNGVFVNGERVERHTLQDGDEILVGRYHLHFIEARVQNIAA